MVETAVITTDALEILKNPKELNARMFMVQHLKVINRFVDRISYLVCIGLLI